MPHARNNSHTLAPIIFQGLIFPRVHRTCISEESMALIDAWVIHVYGDTCLPCIKISYVKDTYVNSRFEG